MDCNSVEPDAEGDADEPQLARCNTWSDVTFMEWMALHVGRPAPNTARVHLDGDFARKDFEKIHSKEYQERFHRAHVGGRPPSAHRQTLQFYSSIPTIRRPDMRSFLNYVISYGDCITDNAVAMVLACLESRHNKESLKGEGPTWGAHETFECGTWLALPTNVS